MSLVGVHCWGCARSVEVERGRPARGLAAAGWALVQRRDLLPACAADARARGGPGARPGAGAGARLRRRRAHGPARSSRSRAAPYASGECALRALGADDAASWSVLRDDPELMVFPVIAMRAQPAVGAIGFARSAAGRAHGGTRRATARATALFMPVADRGVSADVRLDLLLASRSPRCWRRLDGNRTTTAEGLGGRQRPARRDRRVEPARVHRGPALRLLEQRLPLAGRIAAALFGLAWSLATLFAVPVLAYEGLGPFETVAARRRSSSAAGPRRSEARSGSAP